MSEPSNCDNSGINMHVEDSSSVYRGAKHMMPLKIWVRCNLLHIHSLSGRPVVVQKKMYVQWDHLRQFSYALWKIPKNKCPEFDDIGSLYWCQYLEVTWSFPCLLRRKWYRFLQTFVDLLLQFIPSLLRIKLNLCEHVLMKKSTMCEKVCEHTLL